MLSVEIVDGCNFSCYFCSAQHISKNVYIDLDLFKRITDEAHDLGITTLNLTPCQGEPFLHPNIYELLEYACSKMKRVLMFTNATPINAEKLAARDIQTLDLYVSFYGDNPERFIELTKTNKHLYTIFHKKLAELTEHKISYTIRRRDINYEFDYEGGPSIDGPEFDPAVKCIYHQNAKVYPNGKMSFCNFARVELPNHDSIFFADLNDMSLKDAMTDPIRYKFYDTQQLCHQHCGSYDRKCAAKHSIATLKLLMQSKARYTKNLINEDRRFEQLVADIDEMAL